jgi:hypothetical protein
MDNFLDVMEPIVCGVQYLTFITRVFQGYHDLTWMITTRSSSSRILKIQQPCKYYEKNPIVKTLTMVRVYKERDEINCHTFW